MAKKAAANNLRVPTGLRVWRIAVYAHHPHAVVGHIAVVAPSREQAKSHIQTALTAYNRHRKEWLGPNCRLYTVDFRRLVRGIDVPPTGCLVMHTNTESLI